MMPTPSEEAETRKNSLPWSSSTHSRGHSTDFQTTGSSTDSNEQSSRPSISHDNEDENEDEHYQDENEELVWDPQLIWIKPVTTLPGPGKHPLLDSLLDKLEPDTSTDLGDAMDMTPLYPALPAPSLSPNHVESIELPSSGPGHDDDMSTDDPRQKPQDVDIRPGKSECKYGYVRKLHFEGAPDQLLMGEIWTGATADTGVKWKRHQWIID
jgi:hypothetical protein